MEGKLIVLRVLFFILVGAGVFYGIKCLMFKFWLSLDERVETLKESKEDVRSSLSEAEQQLSEDRKSLKEARKSV